MNRKNEFSQISIENVKSFWNHRPCNFRHSTRQVGSYEYFKEVEKKKFFVEPHLVEFADFSSIKGKKVLEIGCGLGVTTIHFAKAGASKVTAIDISDRSIELAKKNAEVNHLSGRIDFYNINAETLSESLPQESYDLIFSFGVIHHSPHPENILKEAFKYLSSDGILKIMVYHRFSFKVLNILIKRGIFHIRKLSKLIAFHSEAQQNCPITYVYSQNEAAALLQSCGFQIIETRIEHIFPYRIKEYLENKYVKKWYFRILPLSFFKTLERKFGWHLCITAKKQANKL